MKKENLCSFLDAIQPTMIQKKVINRDAINTIHSQSLKRKRPKEETPTILNKKSGKIVRFFLILEFFTHFQKRNKNLIGFVWTHYIYICSYFGVDSPAEILIHYISQDVVQYSTTNRHHKSYHGHCAISI